MEGEEMKGPEYFEHILEGYMGKKVVVKAQVVETESGKGSALIGQKRIIEIKGVWTAAELADLLKKVGE